MKNCIPTGKGGKIQKIREYGHLLSQEYRDDGIYVKARVPAEIFVTVMPECLINKGKTAPYIAFCDDTTQYMVFFVLTKEMESATIKLQFFERLASGKRVAVLLWVLRVRRNYVRCFR